MSVVFDKPASIADLLEALGGIDPARIRLRPAPGEAVEQDVVEIRDRERRIFELVDGVLVEKIMGLKESVFAAILIRILGEFVKAHDLGVIAGPDGMMRFAPGLIRIPDVSFIAWSRFPGRRLPDAAVPDLAPDLAVEVLSQGNTRREMLRKVAEYFAAGVRLVWLIDPVDRAAEIFTGAESSTVIRGDEPLEGRDVVPGFELPLSELFEDLRR